MPVRRYLGAAELADIIPFSLNTIRKKTSLGEIPHIKRGRKVIYDWDRISEWLQEGAAEPASGEMTHIVCPRCEKLDAECREFVDQANELDARINDALKHLEQIIELLPETQRVQLKYLKEVLEG